jgi:beta-lactamase class A
MRIILLSSIIFGFVGWNHSGHSSPPDQHQACREHMSFKAIAGVHLKLSKPTPPIANRIPAPNLTCTNISITTANTLAALQNYLDQLADSLHAEIGVAWRDLETGREFFFNEKQMMHAASTMKVPVMIEVFRQAETDEAPKFRLDDSLLIKNEFKSIVDGSPYRLDLSDDSDSSIYPAIGTKMTIRQLVESMITASSNLATNILIERVGAENVMATLRELGVKNMQVRRGVEDTKAYQRGLNNQTDAFDFMLTLQAIAEKRAASPKACDTMLAILQRQKFRDGIPAGLPSGALAANKTGWITGITHDGAIVFPEKQASSDKPRRPYVLVVLTKGIQEEKSAQRVIAAISGKIYSAIWSAKF